MKKYLILGVIIILFAACGKKNDVLPENILSEETALQSNEDEPVREVETEEEPIAAEEISTEEEDIIIEETPIEDDGDEEITEEKSEEDPEEINEETPISNETEFEQIFKLFNIPQGQSGAYDIDMVILSSEAAGSGMATDANVKFISDGNRAETLITTDLNGMFGGIDMQIAVYSVTEGGEVTESRIYISGVEISPETMASLGFSDLEMLAGLSVNGILDDISLGVEDDEVQILNAEYDENGNPVSFRMEIYSPDTGTLDITITINAIGGEVEITLPGRQGVN